AGFKFAVLACDDHFLTLQLRTYIPTGDADRGLGTDHVSLEPAVLLHQRLIARLALDAELRDWIPLGGTPWAGNVVRYGAALSYLVVDRPKFRALPVVEMVGWTVLDGKELAVTPNLGGIMTQDASGDTIVNAKVGVRFGFGKPEDVGYFSRSDLYV